jgi:hypothetical protein
VVTLLSAQNLSDSNFPEAAYCPAEEGIETGYSSDAASGVLAGRMSGAEETEMEPHEYDEIIRTLVRIAAHQDLINQQQDLSNQQQQLINQRLERNTSKVTLCL